MYHIRTIASLLLLTMATIHCQETPCLKDQYSWTTLPSIPDSTGFAGSFAGVHNGVLIVAGGSNFPNGGAPWKGSTKTWYDKVFVFQQTWREVGRLPIPLGYGVSISTNNGLIIVGGSNENGHYANVWRLQYVNGHLQTDTLPSLPFTLANACGALIGNHIYIAGGLTAPDASTTASHFLSLDLSKPATGWRMLTAWPGPSRMLAVAGVAGGNFYLFSGTHLVNGVREYLKDAYIYNPASGWKAIAALPHAVVAAPSPAYQLTVFGGDDGVLAPQAMQLREQHPGFSKDIIQYNEAADRWQSIGSIGTDMKAPVTTPLVVWNDQLIFPGGEIRPATRTTAVLSAKPCSK